MFSRPSVIIDNGSHSCKAGFSCDNHPVAIFRTVVGRPLDRVGEYGKTLYNVYIGDEAVAQKDYELNAPVVCGKIVHWENMERVWHHIFYKMLKVAPEEQGVVLALATKTSLKDKVKCCEVFFENLNAPALSIQPQSTAALYGSGYTTGLSVDLGYDSTCISPIYEGGCITYAQSDTHFSGSTIENYIETSLKSRGIELGDFKHKVISDIQQKIVIPSEPSATVSCPIIYYTLPDGKKINISKEVHTIPEFIFNPKEVMGEDTNIIALHTATINAVMRCDAELHDEMYAAVVPTGGLSALPGLVKRLEYEMEMVLDRPVNVTDSSESYCLSWLGASIFAGIKDVEKIWVKKKQFEEYGEKIVRNRFL